MQKLEVFIEENAFGSVRPVEVVADEPVATLIPALVAELRLPRTDLFGRELTYTLRETRDRSILSNDTTLQASGVKTGTVLALANWLHWLYRDEKSFEDREAVARQLATLVERVERW